MKTGSLKLTLLGLMCVAFFWMTDPRLGLGDSLDGDANTNVVEAMHALWPGTLVGLAGSGMVVLIGLWLGVRRKA
jgi:hypothetical protein